MRTKTMKVLHSLATGLLSATSILVRRVAFLLLFLGAALVLVQPCASAAGVFTNTGSLNIGRSQHTATLLPNGKVLVAGGVDNNNNALASAELYDPVSGTWTATGNLNTARYLHTATLLPNGKVLVAGGLRTGNSFLASAELYDPASGTWTGTGSLADGRFGQTATLLPNGKVLVATGATNSFLASAELYDPASGTWTATGSLADGRFGHTATLLPNGNVLVAGGYNASSLASAELYNPASGTWTATGSLNIARQDHTATLLPNRNVLVAGGVGTSGYLTSAELYDPASGTWTATGSLNTARYDHTATSLLNGMVLLAEGFGSSGVPASTELYRTVPSAAPTCPGPWKPAAPVGIDHYGGFMDSDATFAYEGGGYSFSVGDNINEFGRFDPVANTWTSLAPVPDLNNANASGVYAPNVNKLFVFGGENVATSTVVNTTRIYDSASNTWSIGAPMPDVRDFMGSGYYNGKIYLVGGYSTGNVDPSFGQVWEYDPVLNSFNTSRASMPITMGGPGFGIVNGHIYIAGGRNLNNNNLNTLYDYDIVADTWTQRANLPTGIEVPGSAVFIGKLWVFGGGNPFLDLATAPKSAKTGVRAWLNGLLHPDTTNILQLYDPATDTWMSGPPLNQQRSFSAGTDVGDIAVVAVGGYTGSNTT